MLAPQRPAVARTGAGPKLRAENTLRVSHLDVRNPVPEVASWIHISGKLE